MQKVYAKKNGFRLESHQLANQQVLFIQVIPRSSASWVKEESLKT